MKLACDVMQRDIVSVGMDEPILGVYRLFHDEEISGAPVVNELGRVVGVVSMTDLVRAVQDDQEGMPTPVAWYEDSSADIEWSGGLEDRFTNIPVQDVMTSEVVSVPPDAPISYVAKQLRENRIHRVLVVDKDENPDRLLGIISLFDLVALLE